MTEVKPPTSISGIRGTLTAKEGFDHMINESMGRNLSGESNSSISYVAL